LCNLRNEELFSDSLKEQARLFGFYKKEAYRQVDGHE